MHMPQWFVVFIIGLQLFRVQAEEVKAFINPLNNKAIDLFLAVDESSAYIDIAQLGLLKSALNNIATKLNPPGSTPYFGTYFFGSAKYVRTVVPFKTNSASSFQSHLDNKQYTIPEFNPSTLDSALATISSDCRLYCRPTVPRVTIVITNSPDFSAKSAIRQLEIDHGMTVILVVVGTTFNYAPVHELASNPARYYALAVENLFQLSAMADHISSIASDVPRQLTINTPLHVPFLQNNVYHTLQLNTYSLTATDDAIIVFGLNCASCTVYGSLSEPNPINENTPANTNRHSFYAYPGYPNTLYYFRVPMNTGRIFLSFRGTVMNDARIVLDAFPVSHAMTLYLRNGEETDLQEANS